MLSSARLTVIVCLVVLGTGAVMAQPAPSDPSASGGELIWEQAAFDVHYYDLRLHILPEQEVIEGHAETHATVVLPTSALVLDLDTTFAVAQVVHVETEETLPFERLGGRLLINLGWTMQPGDSVAVRVDYAGKPRTAPNPPWEGGFTWIEWADGTHWVGVSVQGEGADLWWPVKDHPSDEPDSLRLRVTVPAGHTAVSAGRLRDVTDHGDTHTFDWFVSTPINNYGLSLYVAPYVPVTMGYTSTAGDSLPITFYALPEDRAKAEILLPQIADHVRFMEETFGPYPFRADKYAVVQAPYLGMEHQTAIAYGDAFTDNAFGFDWLHLHEFAHEWWGNLVTVPDWRHFWIHEGMAEYVEALYAERLGGEDAYRRYLLSMRHRIRNERPVVPRTSVDTQAAHFGTEATDSDVYFKGMWFVHTLRYAIDDDEAFFRSLRRMTYPTPEMETITDGRQTRFVTTDDFRRTFESETGRDLGDLFRLYLDQPALPRLVTTREPDRLRLRWETPEEYPLDLPVEVSIGGETQRVPMPDGRGEIDLPPNAEVAIDPNDWILKAE